MRGIGSITQQSNPNFVNVVDKGISGDGVTDVAAKIQALIDSISVSGGGIIFFPPGSYALSTSLTPKSNITLLGAGSASILFRTTTGNIIDGRATAFNDFNVEELCFTGSVNQTVSVPTRARTTSGPGTQTAIFLSGSLDTSQPGNAVLTNFTMRRCIVRNCSALPIRIGGVSGVVKVVDCEFTNNQDVGFLFNEEVIFSNNHVKMSADNGVSLSRGNTKITCTGNTFENCCYNGIWIAGFNTDLGPTNFSCCGNTVKNI